MKFSILQLLACAFIILALALILISFGKKNPAKVTPQIEVQPQVTIPFREIKLK